MICADRDANSGLVYDARAYVIPRNTAHQSQSGDWRTPFQPRQNNTPIRFTLFCRLSGSKCSVLSYSIQA
jgi:hypothetical protein